MSHPLLARLRDPDPEMRVRACREVAEDPSAVLLLDALGEGLADPERTVRRAACDGLVALAGRHPEVAVLLKRSLRAADPTTRRSALDALRRLGPPEPGWLPVLVEALASEHGDERWTAARLLVDLGRLHGETGSVASGLALHDERPRVRRMALFCAVELAPDDPATHDLLERLCADGDAEVRRAAGLALSARRARS